MIINQKNIAILFLFVPLFLHWLLPEGEIWEQAFTTIGFGKFKYSWVCIFYVLYYLLYTPHKQNVKLLKLRLLFIIGLLLCPLVLIVADNGKYALELFLSAIPFFIVPIILITRPLNKEDLTFVKYPLLLVFLITVYFYVNSTFTNGFFGVNSRPITLIGDTNASSFFLATMSCLISSIYCKSNTTRIFVLLFSFALIIAGACRGAFLFMFVICSIYLFQSLKKNRWYYKMLLVICIAAFVYICNHFELFSGLSSRTEELIGSDITSGRTSRATFVMNNTWRDSPILGVGHGRVFPTSKDLLTLKNDQGLNISAYSAAPHNIYVLTFGEYGIVGIILLCIGLFYLLTGLNYNEYPSYIVLVLAFICGNTEAILYQDDLWPLFWIIVSISRQ